MKSAPLLLLAVSAASWLVQADGGGDALGNPPPDFDRQAALDHYSSMSRELLRSAMIAAGFDGEDLEPDSDAYLDFASLALTGEKRRLLGIREALREKQEGTCSTDDPTCGDPASGRPVAKTKMGEFEKFLTPDLEAGYADIIKFEDDGKVVHDYAARVGLPEHFVPTLRKYAEDMGLWKIMKTMLYEDPLEPGGARWFNQFHSPYQTTDDPAQLRNFTWNVERPAKKWKSDMHWFNTADELSHEDSLRALARGGFDSVLQGIGKRFGLETLHVDSFGFVAVTNCQRGFLHTDWEDVGGGAFNFLVGIYSPEDSGPELIVESEDEVRRGEVHYGTNAGILVGDGARHGTRECDHRASREVRITASIYLADLNGDNLDVVAGDTTSIFPPTGEGDGARWIWTQRGRHWNRDDRSVSLVNDAGRKPFKVSDVWDHCDKSKCHPGDEQVSVNEGEDMRNKCLKTCGVFLDDEVYLPGKRRNTVLGY